MDDQEHLNTHAEGREFDPGNPFPSKGTVKGGLIVKDEGLQATSQL